jgi:cystathionine gamma-synthase
LRKWLAEFGITWGLEVSLVDTRSVDAVAAALRPGRTRLLWLETPANPTWELADIAALAEVAHRAHARVVVDSTVATPVLSRPISHGADLVMHSATKFLNGHSDVLAGALVTARDDPFWERLRAWRREQGAVLGPFEAWLLLRGMRTLHVRVRHQVASAQRVAHHFAGHRAVSEVLYPGLVDHPGHEIACAQMVGGFGSMLSLRVVGGEAAAVAVAAAVRVFGRATSLGGTESLIEHRASVEGPSTPVPADLLRLSIGLEDPDDLIADLEQALDLGAAGATPAQSAGPGRGGVVDPPVPEGDRAMVIARGGELGEAGPVGSPGAWRALGYQRPRPAPPPGLGLAERVAFVLDHEVAPAVAAHGGQVTLDGIDVDGTVRLRLAGGCQGCALAEVTVHQGLVPMLRELDGVSAVVDVTDHGAGTAPYYKPAKR